MTQEEAALLSGVTHAYYGGLERGRIDRAYSVRMLDGVAHALRLSGEERRVLYVLAAGREPEPLPVGDGPCRVTPAAVVWVFGQRWPSFISGPTFDVLVCNPPAWAWLPGLAQRPNLVGVWFTSGTRAQCAEWETRVAPRAIARLRAQLAKLPDDDRLQQVVHDVLGSCPAARRLWESQGDVSWYDDGARLSLTLPGASQPTTVEFMSATSQRTPDLSITTMIPVGGHIPPCEPLSEAERVSMVRGAPAAVGGSAAV